MAITLTAPNVNEGSVGFSVVNQQIVFGLAAIKGIGEKVVELIIAERKAKGPFSKPPKLLQPPRRRGVEQAGA
jgi:DNA polymerase-3 subunit alpha